jgi:hypothetical protein
MARAVKGGPMVEHEPNRPDDTGEHQPQELRFDVDFASTSPSVALIETLASAKNTDPVALSADKGVTLSDYVDADALDRLMTDSGENSVESITLSIDDYSVRIEEREIVVTAGEVGDGSKR